MPAPAWGARARVFCLLEAAFGARGAILTRARITLVDIDASPAIILRGIPRCALAREVSGACVTALAVAAVAVTHVICTWINRDIAVLARPSFAARALQGSSLAL